VTIGWTALNAAMRDWRPILARNVRLLRHQKGLTQEKLAALAEIDLTYMGGIERERRNPTLMVMGRIAHALSVPLPALFEDGGGGLISNKRKRVIRTQSRPK
jgi:transcriptional regulator with XRE-family HTH domain